MQIKQNIDNTVLQKSNYWVFLRGKKNKNKSGTLFSLFTPLLQNKRGIKFWGGVVLVWCFSSGFKYWSVLTHGPADVFLTTFIAAYERSVTVWPCKTFGKSAYIIYSLYAIYRRVRAYISVGDILCPKMCLSYIDPGDSLFMCW